MKKRYVLPFSVLLINACKPAPEKVQEESVSSYELVYPSEDRRVTDLRIPGELQPYYEVDLYAKVNGFVQNIFVDVGSEVQKGQLLAVLEAPEMKAQIHAAAARLQAMEALYAGSNATLIRLEQTNKTPGTIAPLELELSRAKMQGDKAQLEAARAAFKETQEMQTYLEIRAPFRAAVVSRNVAPGAFVGPSGKGSDAPLFTLVQNQNLRLVVLLPETYSGSLPASSPIKFTVPSLPGQEFQGTVARNAQVLDPKLRSQRIEVDVVNSQKKLIPGMVAQVNLPLQGRAQELSIPKTALLHSTKGQYIIKVQNGIAKWEAIRPGLGTDSTVLVHGNLSTEEAIVRYATEEIRDGMKIK
jgi:membrane fusion protein (multidrug efflux system)